MDSAVQLIRECCRMDQLGGRVHVVDDMRTLLVYDVAHFPAELVAKLKLFRGASVEVLAETTSLSGFVVRVRVSKRRNKLVVLALCYAVAVAFYIKWQGW